MRPVETEVEATTLVHPHVAWIRLQAPLDRRFDQILRMPRHRLQNFGPGPRQAS